MAELDGVITGFLDRLELGEHELISLVGGGGKSTLLLGAGRVLATAGKKVVLTTTTKLGSNQLEEVPRVCWLGGPAAVGDVAAALDGAGPVMAVARKDRHRVIGPAPDLVDAVYRDSGAEYVIVEADGARRRPTKAPADYEPVIPRYSTIVVIVMGIDAVGRTIEDAALRPDRYAALVGAAVTDRVRPVDCATVLGHPDGGLKGISTRARAVVALTKVGPGDTGDAAARISELLAGHDRIERVLTVPHHGEPAAP